jgi:hypothetical protein
MFFPIFVDTLSDTPAYLDSTHKLFMAAMIVTFGTLLAALFASNFYLGQAHNAVETHKIIKFRDQEETAPEVVMAKAQEANERARKEVQG